MTLRILEGNVPQVIKVLRQPVSRRRLIGAKRKALLDVAACLDKNGSRMITTSRFPIASGPVEGACKNLIMDRMERSGMRWTPPMAETLVRLRSLYLRGYSDSYWSFHDTQDQLRLHPPGRWCVVAK